MKTLLGGGRPVIQSQIAPLKDNTMSQGFFYVADPAISLPSNDNPESLFSTENSLFIQLQSVLFSYSCSITPFIL